MRLSVHHITRHSYSEPVTLAQSRSCLLPRNTPRQMVLSSALSVIPEASFFQEGMDFFGNHVVYFTLQDSVRSFEVVAQATVDVLPQREIDPASTPAFELIREELRRNSTEEAFLAGQYLFPSPLVPDEDAILEYARESFPVGQPVLAGLIHLSHRVFTDFQFDPSATDVSTPLRRVLELKRGVCQDFAHLMVACARAVGLPARYVSGYILTQPPPGKPRLIGADASHAWASVWCGMEAGWVDIDPTNDRLVDDEYITIGWGRDYQDVSPLRGVILGGGQQTVSVHVTVTPEETEGVKAVSQSRLDGPDLFPQLPEEANRFGPAPVMRALLASQTRMSAAVKIEPVAANQSPAEVSCDNDQSS